MHTKSSIFKSGTATSINTAVGVLPLVIIILRLVFMIEIKNDITLKKTNLMLPANLLGYIVCNLKYFEITFK